METATNKPRAISSPYFAIHSPIIHFKQCKEHFRESINHVPYFTASYIRTDF